MNAEAILQEFDRLGVRLRVETGHIIARPLSAVSPELRKAATAHKTEMIETLQANEALHLLNRLKIFVLPAGRMAAARQIADRCTEKLMHWREDDPVFLVDDPGSILTVLRNIERELFRLGGAPDPELAEVVATVECNFPGARLVEIRGRH
jgi:hypothetical protein